MQYEIGKIPDQIYFNRNNEIKRKKSVNILRLLQFPQ